MTTTAAPTGLTLSELAARQGRSEEAVLALLRPFISAGIVAEEGGQLYVADRLVRAAFEQEPSQ